MGKTLNSERRIPQQNVRNREEEGKGGTKKRWISVTGNPPPDRLIQLLGASGRTAPGQPPPKAATTASPMAAVPTSRIPDCMMSRVR